ncbi:related to TNA1 - high affinity nicotinic acid plasma membrane permease [Melanopsichium pennsylvanicum]|uniref:Related to TNA1 - high affinity nicotinic acid plasma membrane permease n=1 Tax=Melanopsichium pennsylvanicum TaxID=63383 RepID=A0AAJ4XP79_9BASI|nr:related to TNA1 - high affinity nicotinic acid plasma membrane permease [Melanopsichium pennsylvanicum]
MTSTTSPEAVIKTTRDIERASSSEDEKHHTESKHSGRVVTVPSLYASGTFKSQPSLIMYDAQTENKLVRKIDLYIVPIVAMLYLMCFIDRANVGNARIAGLEKDLGMNPKSYDFNILLTAFYAAYAAFEIPSTTLTKILGPGRWIPSMAFLFGLLSMVNGFVTNFGSAIAVRFLLGVAEAGMLPSIAYYLSRWYKKDELVLRLGLYLVMAPSAGAFGGLLASAILKIPQMGSVKGWEQIFLIEGLVTMIVAIIAYFTLTDSIHTARWLTEEEKTFLQARLKSEMVGQKQLVDKTHKKLLWKGIISTTSLCCAAMFFLVNIAVQGNSVFLPSIVRNIYPPPKYTVIQQQLLTVPPNVAGAIATLVFAYYSAKFRIRWVFVVAGSIVMMIGYAMFLGSKNLYFQYAASFFATSGAFTQGALLPAYAAVNANNDSERTGAIAVTVFFGNLGGLISTWSYLSKYSPDFVPGNALNCAGAVVMVIISVCLVTWQRWENKQRQMGKRDHRLQRLTDEEIQLLGSDHPHFRLRY